MKTYLQRQLSPKHFQAIGRVAAEWTHLEAMVELGIWYLADIAPAFRRGITVEMRIRQRLNVLGVLVHERFADKSDIRSEFDRLIVKIQQLEQKRNDAIHAEWQDSRNPFVAHIVTGRRYKFASGGPGKRKRIEPKVFWDDPSTLEATADQIAWVADDLASMLAAFRTAQKVFPPP